MNILIPLYGRYGEPFSWVGGGLGGSGNLQSTNYKSFRATRAANARHDCFVGEVRGMLLLAQCRYVGDQVVTFEINPRFSGTTFIRALAGYNEPDLLLRREVLGESVEPFFAYDESISTLFSHANSICIKDSTNTLN